MKTLIVVLAAGLTLPVVELGLGASEAEAHRASASIATIFALRVARKKASVLQPLPNPI